MNEPHYDAVIHAPNRLQICSMLAAVDSMEFSRVRESLGVSDSVLSKHLKVLERAGYVEITKARGASYPRTWIALTHDGRRALAGHIAELRRIVDLAYAPSIDDGKAPPPD
ncbi:winged helix-turn-helix domain-containing protein [Streptomyces sp. MUM 178J]|uniref:winged helix-turn-helix domain-containing protein n=1 Tax=Streptomyces sp. MUM 178J TaxID=2791991 RepID=UPI001F035CB8|nr:transcriptional regulator [Streptomyces sp. MUM 178J]WRQ82486.1 transcriptional regulator [Streptomyces sp. MUM 178J]